MARDDRFHLEAVTEVNDNYFVLRFPNLSKIRRRTGFRVTRALREDNGSIFEGITRHHNIPARVILREGEMWIEYV